MELLTQTFLTIFTTDVFFYCILGVVAGMVIGTLPGLSATMGIAILTPLTFWLEPAQGMAVLLGIYNSAIWAGGISAILINTPGTPASIAQTFDGYYMVSQGKVKKALNMNTIYSVIGGLMGTVVLIVFAFPVARFALKFGPPEMFAMALFGLSMMIGVSGGNILKGLLAGALGPDGVHHRHGPHDRFSALYLRQHEHDGRHRVCRGHGRYVRRGRGPVPDQQAL